MATKNEHGDETVEAPPPEDTNSGFKAAERDVDPEATVTKLAPPDDDDETVVKGPAGLKAKPPPPAPPAPAAPLADDEATRLAPRAPPAARPPTAAPPEVSAVSTASAVAEGSVVAAAQRRRVSTWLVVAGLGAVLLFLASRLIGGGARPEDLKPLRDGQSAEEKRAAEKRSTFKSLFDW